MRALCVEIARPGALLAPRFDERAVFGELDNTRIGVAAVAVADEDVAVRRDEDGGRHVERIGSIARDACLAERHQEFAVSAKLENLMTVPILPWVRSEERRVGKECRYQLLP